MLDAKTILKTAPAQAKLLFPGGEQEIRRAFRRLVLDWHPDRNPDSQAARVIAHLKALRQVALRGQGCDLATIQDQRYFSLDGGAFGFPMLKAAETDGERILIGTKTIGFDYPTTLADLGEAAAVTLSSISFADSAMAKHMRDRLPVVEQRVAHSGGYLILCERPHGSVLLADLIAHFGGSLPARHVAWIISGLEHIGCYLAWAGLSHGAISPKTVFVSPQQHDVHLLGGWGFAVLVGERPRALPRRTLDLVPRLRAPGRTADGLTDPVLIRDTACQALGHANPATLRTDGAVPADVANWIAIPPSFSGDEDYRSWERAREAAFGPQAFVTINTSATEIYGG